MRPPNSLRVGGRLLFNKESTDLTPIAFCHF